MYKCSKCGKEYVREKYLIQHIEKCKNDEYDTDKPNEDTKSIISTASCSIDNLTLTEKLSKYKKMCIVLRDENTNIKQSQYNLQSEYFLKEKSLQESLKTKTETLLILQNKIELQHQEIDDINKQVDTLQATNVNLTALTTNLATANQDYKFQISALTDRSDLLSSDFGQLQQKSTDDNNKYQYLTQKYEELRTQLTTFEDEKTRYDREMKQLDTQLLSKLQKLQQENDDIVHNNNIKLKEYEKALETVKCDYTMIIEKLQSDHVIDAQRTTNKCNEQLNLTNQQWSVQINTLRSEYEHKLQDRQTNLSSVQIGVEDKCKKYEKVILELTQRYEAYGVTVCNEHTKNIQTLLSTHENDMKTLKNKYDETVLNLNNTATELKTINTKLTLDCSTLKDKLIEVQFSYDEKYKQTIEMQKTIEIAEKKYSDKETLLCNEYRLKEQQYTDDAFQYKKQETVCNEVIAELKNTIAANNLQNDRQSEAKNNFVKEIQNLQRKYEEKADELAIVKQNQDNLKSVIDNLNVTIQSCSSTYIDQIQKNKETYTNETIKQQSSVDEHVRKHSDLRAQYNELAILYKKNDEKYTELETSYKTIVLANNKNIENANRYVAIINDNSRKTDVLMNSIKYNQTEYTNLMNQYTATKADYNRLQSDMDKLKSDQFQETMKLEIVKNNNTELSKQLDELKINYKNDVNSYYSQSHTQFNTVQITLNEKNEMIKKLEDTIRGNNDVVEQNKKLSNDEKTALNDIILSLRNDIQVINNSIQQYQDTIASMTNKCTEYQIKLTNLEQQHKTDGEIVATLTAKIDACNNTLGRYEHKIMDGETMTRTWKTEYITMATEIKQLTERCNSHLADINVEHAKTEETVSKLAEVENTLKIIQHEYTTLCNEKGGLQGVIKDYDGRIEKLTKELGKKENIISTMDMSTKKLKEELLAKSRVLTEMDTLKEVVKKQQEDVVFAKTELEKCEGYVRTIRTSLVTKTEECIRISADLGALKQKYDELNTEIIRIRSSKDSSDEIVNKVLFDNKQYESELQRLKIDIDNMRADTRMQLDTITVQHKNEMNKVKSDSIISIQKYRDKVLELESKLNT